MLIFLSFLDVVCDNFRAAVSASSLAYSAHLLLFICYVLLSFLANKRERESEGEY